HAAEVMQVLRDELPQGRLTSLPATEKVVRPLTPLRKSPRKLTQLYLEAVTSAGEGNVTADLMKAQVQRWRQTNSGKRSEARKEGKAQDKALAEWTDLLGALDGALADDLPRLARAFRTLREP